MIKYTENPKNTMTKSPGRASRLWIEPKEVGPTVHVKR